MLLCCMWMGKLRHGEGVWLRKGSLGLGSARSRHLSLLPALGWLHVGRVPSPRCRRCFCQPLASPLLHLDTG